MHRLVAVDKHAAAARGAEERNNNVGSLAVSCVVRVGGVKVHGLAAIVGSVKTLTATIDRVGLVHLAGENVLSVLGKRNTVDVIKRGAVGSAKIQRKIVIGKLCYRGCASGTDPKLPILLGNRQGNGDIVEALVKVEGERLARAHVFKMIVALGIGLQSPTVGAIVGDAVVKASSLIYVGKINLIALNANVLDRVGIDIQFLFLGGKVGKLCSLFLAPSVFFESLLGNLGNACGRCLNQGHVLVIVAVNGKGLVARKQKLNVTDCRKLACAVFELDVYNRCNELLVIAFGNYPLAVIKQLGVGYNVNVCGLIVQKAKRHGAKLACLENVFKRRDKCAECDAFNSSFLAKLLERRILFEIDVGGKANAARVL